MSELIKRLKINQVNQMIVALALVESCREDVQHEGNIPILHFHILRNEFNYIHNQHFINFTY
jgi:ribosomal protein L30E